MSGDKASLTEDRNTGAHRQTVETHGYLRDPITKTTAETPALHDGDPDSTRESVWTATTRGAPSQPRSTKPGSGPHGNPMVQDSGHRDFSRAPGSRWEVELLHSRRRPGPGRVWAHQVRRGRMPTALLHQAPGSTPAEPTGGLDPLLGWAGGRAQLHDSDPSMQPPRHLTKEPNPERRWGLPPHGDPPSSTLWPGL